ncbi:MAG: ribosome-associated translation inhibitor RaiA [Bacteroidetes bacterium]|nr:ribosome-associated translation inhibitor RaiA [Bacteroidota bacterium]
MNIKISAVHFKTDRKLEDFIRERMQKMQLFFEGVIDSEVILKLENTDSQGNKIVEIRLFVPGFDLFAKKQSWSFEESTDLAVEALRKQLVKHKEKIRGL